jgi:hypothetical protein
MTKSKEKLYNAMNSFMKAYTEVLKAIEDYEGDLGSISKLEAFNKYYPFDKNLYELKITRWVLEATDELKNGTTKVDVAHMIEHVNSCADAVLSVDEEEYEDPGPITVKINGVETKVNFGAETFAALINLLRADEE